MIPAEDQKLISHEQQQILNLSAESDKTKITDLGLLLSTIPLAPKFAKMLVFGQKCKIVTLAILAVSSLTVNEIFKAPKLISLNSSDIEDVDLEFNQSASLVTQIDLDNKMSKIKREKDKADVKLKEQKKLYVQQKFKMRETIRLCKVVAKWINSDTKKR